MKREYQKRILAIVLLIICCGVGWIVLKNYKNTEKSNGSAEAVLRIEKVTASQGAIDCLEHDGIMTIAHNLKDPEFFHISDFSLDNVQVMEPFVVYFGSQDSYYFPVVSNGKVLFTLDVFLSDTGEYQCGSGVNGEWLTGFMGDGECNRVYVDLASDHTSAEFKTVPVNSDEITTSEVTNPQNRTKENIRVLKDVSDTVSKEYNLN